MKFIFLFVILISHVTAQTCSQGLMMVWTQSQGYHCLPRFPTEAQVIQGCFGPITPYPQIASMPLMLSQTDLPLWALQGQWYYPNVSYPGPWSYPGIQQQYYPGEGRIFAAKPNVYVDSISSGKKFNFRFTSKEKIHFLATTPVLSESLSWSGRIIEKDKYEVDEVNYDYLFYDVRLPKEKMQFENGLCSTRSEVIQWMMKDLKEMRYSDISLQDFEEHWKVKIPQHPFYCVYPQYNNQLDPILPVEIDIEQNTFVRSLYVLIPHQKEPELDDPAPEIPYPVKDPTEFRPSTLIKREVEFREWGVAFLGY